MQPCMQCREQPCCILCLPGGLEVQLHATREQERGLQARGVNASRRIEKQDLVAALGRLTGGGSPGSVTAVLCGPPRMVDDMSATLLDLGMQQARIRAEKWW